ncbi:SRPBCC family protein [Streptomyces sp. NBC_01235]|uniref:SRPBCC family protein n=1 Tax=Streptomyces sp. NBC_01235 TaxID=2903788 RepID=UPI002E163F44|nr:SRPBCC family protein [Streptomyces sp. NBC_01235]
MSAIKETVDIGRRPEEVFAYVTDPSHMPQWQESAVSAHRVGDSPMGVGSRAKATWRIGRLEFPMTMEVTEFDPPRSWRLIGIGGPARGQVHGTIEPLDDGASSRLTIDLDFETYGMGKLLAPLVLRPQARKELPRDEQTLKKLLEQGAA